MVIYKMEEKRRIYYIIYFFLKNHGFGFYKQSVVCSSLCQLGRDEPAMSMDASGKVLWARHSEVQQAHLNTVTDTQIEDGGTLLLAVKHMGSCEIYPQSLKHSPNGR